MTEDLDIACGTGLATWLASLRGTQVSGIDASAASIEIALASDEERAQRRVFLQ